ncbi:MAG: hypothetical protein IK054_05535, partial [Lachnospiraceae bacterium]|nr:hypothetical protein [Lachnospiraceae bacterium]
MMRITNSIIANNSKINVNGNKVSVDKLNQQMSDQKKIHSPSEDPVIAIRSLRLRGALNQIDQYYTKNIPDAMSWLDITETALTNMKGLISTVSKQCVYGANDPLEKEDRKVIMDELSETRKQIYSEGNADYAGRTLFTGWKTQEFLTFQTDDLNSTYKIKETFKPGDLEDITYINNSPDIKYGQVDEIIEEEGVTPSYPIYAGVTPETGDSPQAKGWYEQSGTGTATDPYVYNLTTDTNVVAGKTYYTTINQAMPTTTETARLALGYNNLTDPSKETPPVTEMTLTYTYSRRDSLTGEMKTFENTIKCKVVDFYDTETRDAAYNVPAKDPDDTSSAKEVAYAHFIPSTGEIILNNEAKLALRNADEMTFEYSKTGFQKGELRPEHYYNCWKSVDEEGNVIKNIDGREEPIEYIKEDNPIDYTVSFNQTIRIN